MAGERPSGEEAASSPAVGAAEPASATTTSSVDPAAAAAAAAAASTAKAAPPLRSALKGQSMEGSRDGEVSSEASPSPSPSPLATSPSQHSPSAFSPAHKARSGRRIRIDPTATASSDSPKQPMKPSYTSSLSSIGRTPRNSAAVESGTHTVEVAGGGGGKVELCVKTWPGDLSELDQGVAAKKLLIVLVHQYSMMGGCQQLMAGLATCLNRLSFSCVTFDMRGVGGSTGTKSVTGAPEVDDVVGVCKWAAEKYGRRLLLVGSSAGAPIAGSALDQVDEIDGYVAIGYVFGFWASCLFGSHFPKILASPKPKLFIMGTEDGFTTPEQLREKLQGANGVADVHLVEGVGHFDLETLQYDEQLAKLIARFSERAQELSYDVRSPM